MKKNILIAMLIFILILLSIYTLYSNSMDKTEVNNISSKSYKTDIDNAYKKGMETAIDLIMKQGIDPKCKPVTISDGKKAIALINLACVTTNTSTGTTKK